MHGHKSKQNKQKAKVKPKCNNLNEVITIKLDN